MMSIWTKTILVLTAFFLGMNPCTGFSEDAPSFAAPGAMTAPQKTVPAGEGEQNSQGTKRLSLSTTNGSLIVASGPLSAPSPSEGHPYGDDGLTLGKPGEGHPYGDDGILLKRDSSAVADVLKPVRNDEPPVTAKPEPENKQKYDDGGMVFKEIPPPPPLKTVLNSAPENQKIDDGGMVFTSLPAPNQKAIENLKQQIAEIEKNAAVQIGRIESQLKKDTERIDAQKEELQKKIQALNLKIAEGDAMILELTKKLEDSTLSKKDRLRLTAEKNRLENQRKQTLLQKQAHEKRMQQLELSKKDLAKKAQEKIAVIRKESVRRISALQAKIEMLLKKTLKPIV